MKPVSKQETAYIVNLINMVIENAMEEVEFIVNFLSIAIENAVEEAEAKVGMENINREYEINRMKRWAKWHEDTF